MPKTATRIGPADHGRAMTPLDFLEAEQEDGYRYELARGVLEVTQIPGLPHWTVVSNLLALAFEYRRTHPGKVQLVGGGNDCRLWMPGMQSARHPDLAIVLRGAAKDLRGYPIPALVAEVVSPSSIDRDYRVKRDEYLACGLLEYWIVDPEARRVTVLVRDGDLWVERIAEGDRIIPSVVLPGLAARVDELWADVDEGGVDPLEP